MVEEEVINEIKEKGYIVFPSFYNIDQEHILFSDLLTKDNSYLVGQSYRTSNLNSLPPRLLDLVVSDKIKSVFAEISKDSSIKCCDVFITHEFQIAVEKARNSWLHFDRLRSLKAMVYLSDVTESCGPFSVVPRSHIKGRELRLNFINEANYEKKLNRIKLDYEHLYEEPLKILGPAGTLILFDTDIFHKGGDVEEGSFRKIIRSHWYKDQSWRVLK